MKDHSEFYELVQYFADEIASEEETRRLQSFLQDDADARKWFRTYLELDAALSRLGDGDVAVLGVKSSSTDRQPVADQESRLAILDPLHHEAPLPSRQARHLFSIATLALAFSLLAIAFLWHGHQSTQTWGTVIQSGTGVQIIRNQQTRRAHPGDSLREGEQIVVASNATAAVSIRGLGTVSLGPDARLQLGSESRVVELQTGFAGVVTKKQTLESGKPWRIRTPQVEAVGVGSAFNIASVNGRTVLRVSKGFVELSRLHGGQSQRVRGGNRAMVSDVVSSSLDIAPSRPGSVLLLTSSKPLNSHWERFNQILIDKLVNARMWRLGFEVEVQHFDSVQVEDLVDRALVIVSLFDYDVGEPAISRIGLARLDLPVLCLEPAAYPVLGMTIEGEGVGFGFRHGVSSVEFPDSSHPLSGGYAGQQDGLLRGLIGWGRPARGATRIGRLPNNPDEAVLFSYDTGQEMTDFAAPARRVGLFLDPTGISVNTTKAWTVFEAAVDWCVAAGVPR